MTVAQSEGPNEAPITSRRANALKTLLKIAFSGLLIWWLIHKRVLDFDSLKIIGTPPLIALCLVSVFVQIFINNYRWLTLMRAQGLQSTMAKTLPLSFIGMFFNFAMPGGVGGDVVKGYYLLKEHPQRKFAAAVSIFMDRMAGFFVMIATAFFALFLNWSEVSASPQLSSLALGVGLLFSAFLVFFSLSFSTLLTRPGLAILFFEKLPGGAKIKALYEVLHSYRHNPKALAIAVITSLASQLVLIAYVAAIGHALGLDAEIPLTMYFFLVPLGTVAQAIPLAPAGIGIGQAAFLFLFKLHLHHDSPVGPVAVTATQLASFAWGLVGAFFYLQRSHQRSPSVKSVI